MGNLALPLRFGLRLSLECRREGRRRLTHGDTRTTKEQATTFIQWWKRQEKGGSSGNNNA
jgi:hypothetical protein